MPHHIAVDWPAPSNVKAYSTTRQGGHSAPPYDGFNLALHVGDDPQTVAQNRRLLQEDLCLPQAPVWLEQVHSNQVIELNQVNQTPTADASFTTRAGVVCAVLTADCLPVLFCDVEGGCVAAAHAGWRGLANGILENTVACLPVENSQILVWLGAAISRSAFEVGDEVYQRFIADNPATACAFMPHGQGHWLADLYQLARIRLQAIGVGKVVGGAYCTYSQTDLFYSYRRTPRTGRIASLIYLSPSQ
jgi:YfiH family protein